VYWPNYRLEIPRFVSLQGQGNWYFLQNVQAALGTTQPPFSGLWGLFARRKSGRPVRVAMHLHLVWKLRVRGPIPPLPICAFMACIGVTWTFFTNSRLASRRDHLPFYVPRFPKMSYFFSHMNPERILRIWPMFTRLVPKVHFPSRSFYSVRIHLFTILTCPPINYITICYFRATLIAHDLRWAVLLTLYFAN
jgi:hypothetical protein